MEIIKHIESIPQLTQPIFSELVSLIDAARTHVAVSVNSTMTQLYWQIGFRINTFLSQYNETAYGKQIVATLSRQLQEQYGAENFSVKNVRRMMQFAASFNDSEKVATLSRQLSWSHLKELIPLKDTLQRDFYLELCCLEHWSVRTLRKKIDGMLYERTAISHKPEETIRAELAALEKDKTLTPNLVFRDPYLLDFLGLRDTYSEKDLESAILVELQKFISELGTDFAFLARQKRITIDNEDYYIDLLFYHRRLRCLVAIDLKLGNFKASYKGQMELYLRWLEKYEMAEGENKPIGLILCAEKNEEHIELMHLDEDNIRVAQYFTQLPDQKLLVDKLQRAIAIAREKQQEQLSNKED